MPTLNELEKMNKKKNILQLKNTVAEIVMKTKVIFTEGLKFDLHYVQSFREVMNYRITGRYHGLVNLFSSKSTYENCFHLDFCFYF